MLCFFLSRKETFTHLVERAVHLLTSLASPRLVSVLLIDIGLFSPFLNEIYTISNGG